jgi:ribosome-binding protein aMBF1 (putative translation factor)
MTLSKDSPAFPNILLRRAREQQGWTQSELAKRLDTNPFTVWG